MRPRRLPSVVALALCLCLSATASAKKRKPASEPEGPREGVAERVNALEEKVDRLEDELEIMKAQSRLLIKHTTLSYLNAFYAKAGLSIVLPRETSFGFNTDTGLGAHLGLGKYFGRIHAFELMLDWDFYPSVTFRYRIEYHNTSPTLTIAPVIGIKQKIASIRPFDNFLAQPDAVKSTFGVAGLYLGVPLARSVLSMEMNALFNGQFTLTMTAGLAFFF